MGSPLGGIIVMCSELQMEWQVPNFFSVPTDRDYNGQVFSFMDADWYLKLHIVNDSKLRNGLLVLRIVRADDGPPKALNCTLGIKDADGKVTIMDCFMQFSKKNTMCVHQRYFFSRSILLERKSLFVPSGILTITCNLKYQSPDGTEVAGVVTKLKTLEVLSQNLRDLFTNEAYCDTTVEVQDKQFQVHRYILTARSSVFAAMFQNDMLEKKTGMVSIPDCDPDSFYDFLLFLYSGKAENISLCSALHLYKTADKYDVQELKSVCVAFMKQNLTANYVCNVIALADLYNETELRTFTQDFFNRNKSKVFETPEWIALIQNNQPLADSLRSNLT